LWQWHCKESSRLTDMVKSMLDILEQRLDCIREEGVKLLREYSNTRPLNKPGDSIVIISPSGDRAWLELPAEGKQIQAKLLPKISSFSELTRTMTEELPNDIKGSLDDALLRIKGFIEQDERTWCKKPEEAADEYEKQINRVISTISEYYGTSTDVALVIPDTNALLKNPDIENWEFEGIRTFTLILTPTVLSELDVLKVRGNTEVSSKAEKVIRKIKDYRRRGSLIQGIAILKNRVYLRSIAAEPDMSKSLSWLDEKISDDRLLATAMEIIRKNMGSKVFIVTADINLQNKAEVASIPYCEVPK